MEDEGMAIVCLYIGNRQKNVRMPGVGVCRGLTGPDGMSSRDSCSLSPRLSHLLLSYTEDAD